MSTITKKIKDKHKDIIDNGIGPTDQGTAIAKALAEKAVAAIINGKSSSQWREYMKNFASNRQQLLRLMGRETDFNNNDWSDHVLAYITSNPICTTSTVTGGNIINTVLVGLNAGTCNSMDRDMIIGLESNIDNVTGPTGWFEEFVAEEDGTN